MSLAKLIERRIEQGVPSGRIAYELGCRKHYVYETKWRIRNRDRYLQKAKAYGERKRRARGARPQKELMWPKELFELAVQLKHEGKSASQIAAVIGKTRNAVIGRLWRAGV